MARETLANTLRFQSVDELTFRAVAAHYWDKGADAEQCSEVHADLATSLVIPQRATSCSSATT